MHPFIAATVLLSGADTIDGLIAAGARQVVASESLPTNISGREEWESLGFAFGQPFVDDPMFRPAVLPPGWSKQRTDHSMWNNIVDASGNVRGQFFCKAVFYDRDALMHEPYTRYILRQVYSDGPRHDDYYDGAKHIAYDVIDRCGDVRKFRASATVELLSPKKGGDHRAWWDEHGVLKAAVIAECNAWLGANFSDHKNAAAYWP